MSPREAMRSNYSPTSLRADLPPYKTPRPTRIYYSAKMASNYEKEPIFLLERSCDNNIKLPEKYKFQGTKTQNKTEVHIDSGTLRMEFFLERTLPEFNQAGTRLNWS
jgi:hypothetical protein